MKRFTEWDTSHTHGSGLPGKDCYTRLAKYEDTGLTPEEIEQMKARLPLHIWSKETPDKLSIFGVTVSRIMQLAEADRSGRLVVLPCGEDARLIRDGEVFQADHWNHTLTAFRDNPETRSGRQVSLFSIKEAEAALEKQKEEHHDRETV